MQISGALAGWSFGDGRTGVRAVAEHIVEQYRADDLTIQVAAERGKAEEAALHQVKGEARPLRYAPALSLALLLRAAAALAMFRGDPRTWFYDQASELTCLAHSILSGQGLSSPFGGSTGPSAFLAPGYPLLVAAVYRIFGASSVRSAEAITEIQAIFGVLIVWMVMIVAKRLFGNRIAYIAGTLCAISPTMVGLPALFWETSLSTLFVVGVVAFALRCVDNPSAVNWIGLGTYCALAMYVNPSLLITFAAVGAWAAWKTRGVSRRGPVLAVAVFTILFAAWPIRNALALHAFVPLRTNLGYELWQGNRQGSEGFFTHDLYLNQNQTEYRRYAETGELAYMREKTAIAMATIKADPARFLRLSLKRAGAFWTGLGGHGMSWVVIGEITITSLFGWAGIFLVVRQGRYAVGVLLIPFLLFPLPYYLTHPDFRFRLLLEPLALVLTAWVVESGFRFVGERRGMA